MWSSSSHIANGSVGHAWLKKPPSPKTRSNSESRRLIGLAINGAGVKLLRRTGNIGNLLSKGHGQPLKGKTPHELKLEGGDPWNASLQIALEIHKTQEACRSQIYDLKSFSQFGLGQESPIAAPADCRIGSVDDPDRMSK